MVNKKKIKNSKPVSKRQKAKKKPNSNILQKILLLLILVGFIVAIKEFPKEEKEKAFEYEGEAWMVVTYDESEAYYPELYFDHKLNHELYLTNDPRTNGVNYSGEFNMLSNSGYLSLSPEVETCLWEMPRLLEELEKFLRYGTKLKFINRTTNDAGYALEMNITEKYQSCYSSINTTVISVEIGEPSVTQDSSNPYCYKIKIKDCRDVDAIEKFITRVIVENNQKE